MVKKKFNYEFVNLWKANDKDNIKVVLLSFHYSKGVYLEGQGKIYELVLLNFSFAMGKLL